MKNIKDTQHDFKETISYTKRQMLTAKRHKTTSKRENDHTLLLFLSVCILYFFVDLGGHVVIPYVIIYFDNHVEIINSSLFLQLKDRDMNLSDDELFLSFFFPPLLHHRMELSSLLHDLHLSSSEKPLPSPPLPPITELLSRLQEKLIGASSDSDASGLIGRVERLFLTADPDWLLSLDPSNEEGGGAELWSAYRSLIDALIGRAALPLCEDDCGSLTPAAYQGVPARAVPVCSALRALLGTLGNGDRTGLLLTAAPPVCVFAVTHFQVSVEGKTSQVKDVN